MSHYWLERGPGHLPMAYRRMLERDVHAPGSVDRTLLCDMIRVTDMSAIYLYESFTSEMPEYDYGARPELESAVARIGRGLEGEGVDGRHDIVCGIAAFLAEIAASADDLRPSDMVFGGTEERIMARRTDWCTDLARLGCVLLQIAGVAARLVNLFDTNKAYSGHQIIEGYVDGRWACIDPIHGYVFRDMDGVLASARDIMVDKAIVSATINDDDLAESYAGLFCYVGLVNYQAMDYMCYDFTESKADSYNLSILDASFASWPNGLRWLHGEDE